MRKLLQATILFEDLVLFYVFHTLRFQSYLLLTCFTGGSCIDLTVFLSVHNVCWFVLNKQFTFRCSRKSSPIKQKIIVNILQQNVASGKALYISKNDINMKENYQRNTVFRRMMIISFHLCPSGHFVLYFTFPSEHMIC